MVRKADIAKVAGVSPATVSNYFNKKKKLSIETEKKILNAANQLNYPLPVQHMRADQRFITLLVVDDILNPHYGQILKGMSNVAVTNKTLVSMIGLWDNVEAFCNMIISQGISAVFFATNSKRITPQHIQMLKDNHIIVCFSWDNFYIDFDGLLDKAIKYLVDLGHSKIAYLSGSSIDDPQNIRYLSYTRALANNNLPFDPELVIDGIYPYSTDAKSGYWATLSFLEKSRPFTAIIALNDLLAIGAMNALQEHGLSIPNDVSVIGCDDIMISEYVSPPLTTLRFSTNDIGKRTMYSILQNHESASNSLPVTLQTQLVIRKSTGKAPAH